MNGHGPNPDAHKRGDGLRRHRQGAMGSLDRGDPRSPRRNPGRDPRCGRDRDPVCGSGGTLRAPYAVGVVGRVGVHFVPLARHARSGRCLSTERAHADDGDRCLGIAQDAGIPRCLRDRGGAGIPGADRVAGIRVCPGGNVHHDACVGNHQCLARCGLADRHCTHGGFRSAAACRAWHRFGPRHWPWAPSW